MPEELLLSQDQVTNANIIKMMQANPGMTLEQARAYLSTHSFGEQPEWLVNNPELQNVQRQIENAAFEKTGADPYVPKEVNPNASPTVKPVVGTNDAGEETLTFTKGMMSRLLTDVAAAALTPRDPNSNIGINPPRTQAQADALPQDPLSVMARNSNDPVPLSADVINQLRGMK